MAVTTVKRLASRILGAGESRIRIADQAEAAKAITADDVRGLISSGAVYVLAAKPNNRSKAVEKQRRKVLGRRRSAGSKKGSYYAGYSRKERWMDLVRSQREYLSVAKPRLGEGAYPKLYRMVKGNAFRSRKNLKQYIDENKLWA